jgi:uncharacterized membrane protein YfcA
LPNAISFAFLCVAAFFAGFIDSIAGGGGLIQLPALLLILPTFPIPVLFGTNKLASIMGTSTAVAQYSRKLVIPWKVILPSAAMAFVGSGIGAKVVTMVPTQYLRPIIIVLLIAASAYLFLKRDMGNEEKPAPPLKEQLIISMFSCGLIGFYDGVFGPGTGSFLIFVFVSFLGMGFLKASASAKVINLATNLAAVIYFAFSGNILYQVALPMAVFNILGGFTGSRMAMLRGNKFVSRFFLLAVGLVIVKLVVDLLG